MRDKERKKHTQCLEAAKPPRRGLWREVLPCALPAILHLSLCGQIRCSISSRSLGTTATCNRQHETIPRQCPKARGWGDAAANPRFLGCRGDGEAGGEGGGSGDLCNPLLKRKESCQHAFPFPPLVSPRLLHPPHPRAASISGARLPKKHPLQVPVPGSTACSRLPPEALG